MDQARVRAGGRVIAAVLCAILIAPGCLAAQGEGDPLSGRGAEALVLSTGASRGLAHAGVLVGLERRGFDPDLVVGASMGAVIGSLYAAGYDAERIWDLVLGIQWADLFIASPEGSGRDRTLLHPSLTLGLDVGRVEVSGGVIPDWRVNRLLVHLLFDADARSRSDFDRLPRRFRAIAADLSDGSEVILGRGDLARAVRVSMSTPGFFSAMRWEGRLLSDGGIADYLPVSVARALGAGRIVAVDVSRAPSSIRRTDPTAIGGRSISLLMRNALPDTLPPDVLILPRIDPDFPGAVFPEQPRLLLDLGLEAGLASALATGPRPTGTRAPAPAPVALVEARVATDDAGLEVLARRALGSVVPGPYRPERVLKAVDALYATGLFTGVWPSVEANERGEDVLVLTLDPLPRLTLSGAVGYDNDSGGRIWGAVVGRQVARGYPLVGRLSAGTDGVERWFEASALAHSLRFPGIAWTAGVDHRRGTPPFHGAAAVAPETRHTSAWSGLDFRRAFPDLMVSAVARVERIEQRGGPEGRAWGPLVRISSPRGPGRVVGIPAEVELGTWRGAHDETWLAARGSVNREVGSAKVAILADARVVAGRAPLEALPSLGDDHLVPGLRRGELRGRVRAVAGLDAARPIVGGGWLRLRLRGGASGDRATLDEAARWVAGAALDGLWNTPFGPIVAGLGANTSGRHRIEVDLGTTF